MSDLEIYKEVLKRNQNIIIKRIYHISDIHINLRAKHNEYKQVFENLYQYLYLEKEKFKIPRDKNQDIECLIVITGDILHSKTELLPECIELTREFLSKLSMIMPVIMMAGNHDLNINNSERLDGLTPIVNGIDKSLPVYYLKKTGLYQYYNITWSLSSVQDYQIINPSEIDNVILQKDKNKNKEIKNYKICLFHGRVNGAILFNDTKLDGETNKKNNKTITPSTFNGYDYTLLGDIHKFQYMKPNIAYAGSLIQQNHGESLNNHGVLVWDLEQGSSQFQEIKNDYGYITFKISRKQHLELIKKRIIKLKEIGTPYNIRLRLQINQMSKTQIQEIQAIFKEHFNLLEVIYSDISQTENNINKEITLNITDVNYQNKLIEDYLLKSSNVDNETINQVKKLNEVFNQTREENKFHLNTRWKLHKLEFSNLFSYGENNTISFRHYKGIVGIIAPNHMGKSSIIDIILFTLFDKFPRKGNIKDIINNRRRTFKTKLTIVIGKWKYIIEKSGNKNEKSRVNCKLNFYRINKDSIKQLLNEDTQSKTKEAILKYIGLYEDIIQTSISLQNNNCNFIEAENTARKKELERILQVNFIEDLSRKVNTEINGKRAIYKHLQDNCYPESIINIQKNIKELIQKLNHNNQEQIKYNQKLEKLELELEDVQNAIIPNIQEKMDKIKGDIGNDPKERLQKLNKKSSSLKKELEKLIKKEEELEVKLLSKTYSEVEKFKKEISSKYKSRKKELTLEIKKFDKILEEKFNSIVSYNLKENSKSSNNLDTKKFNTKIDNEIKKIKKEQDKEKKNLKEILELKESYNQKEEEIKKNNQKLLELNKKLSQLNQEELPKDLIEILEETNVVELRDNFDNDISILKKLNLEAKKTKQNKKIKETKLNIDEFLENTKTLFNYEYIEDYQTLNEIKNQDKQNTLKTIQEIEAQEVFSQKELKKIQKTINTKIKEVKNANNTKNTTGSRNISELQDLVGHYNSRIKDLGDQMVDFEKDKGIYAKNKVVFEEIAKIKKQKQGIEEEIENDEDWNNFEESYELYLKSRELQNNLDEYLLEERLIQDKITHYLNIEKDYLENQNLVSKVKYLKNEISRIKGLLKENEDKMNINKTLFTSNNTKLEEHKKEVVNMNKLEKELNLMSLYLNSLKNLPYIIIKQVVPRIEKKINDLLEVCTNFMVKIEIENNRIDIYIDRPVYEGSLILLNNASGFERFISSLAIRLALLDVSQLPKPNFIAIDEGWSSFDYQNINNVGLIFDYLTQKFDMVLSISHISQIKEHCTEQIQLKKDANGFSIII